MPDTLDALSQQYLNPQLWNLPQQPAPGATHEAPKPDPVAGAIQGFSRPGGGIQAAIEGAGAQPPQWLVGANDWLSQHRGLTNAILQLSEGLPGPAELGMFKFVPKGGRGSFRVLGHNDEWVADIENASLDSKGTLKVDLYGAIGRQSKYPPGHPAFEANPKSHTFEPEELAEMARAGLKDFPGAKKATGFRVTGAKSKRGPASSGRDQYANIPIDKFMKRYPEQFPPMPEDPELSKQLLDIAMENIRTKDLGPAPSELETLFRHFEQQGGTPPGMTMGLSPSELLNLVTSFNR